MLSHRLRQFVAAYSQGVDANLGAGSLPLETKHKGMHQVVQLLRAKLAIIADQNNQDLVRENMDVMSLGTEGEVAERIWDLVAESHVDKDTVELGDLLRAVAEQMLVEELGRQPLDDERVYFKILFLLKDRQDSSHIQWNVEDKLGTANERGRESIVFLVIVVSGGGHLEV